MTLLSFQNVTVPGAERDRLAGLDLSVEAGECVFVLGPNGAGKSTLLRTALALERPARGRVELDADPVLALSPKERARRVAWLPQSQIFEPSLLAWEIVVAARYRFRESHEEAHRRASEALRRVGAEKLGSRVGRELSGGEQQRVKLACLLAQEAPLLLLDEPGNHLDPGQQLDAYRLLGELWKKGLTLVCVTHDINLVSLVGSTERIRIVGLDAGRLAFDTRLADRDLASRLTRLFGTKFEHTLVEGEAGAARSFYHAAPGVPSDDGDLP